jgi:hypothetical protein
MQQGSCPAHKPKRNPIRGKNMNKKATIIIELVPEAKETPNKQIEKEITKSLECDWLQKTQKVTVLEKR